MSISKFSVPVQLKALDERWGGRDDSGELSAAKPLGLTYKQLPQIRLGFPSVTFTTLIHLS